MKQEQVLGLVRYVITIAGGFLVAQGLVTDGAMTEIIGGLMALLGTGWSWWAKTEAAPVVEDQTEGQ
jgi:hypothetical protein